MGNHTYISFPKYTTDEKLEEILEHVVEKYLPTLCFNSSDWTIGPKPGVITSEYRQWGWPFGPLVRETKRKFWHKGMRNEWGYWLTYQIHGYLCRDFGAKISWEFVKGTEKTDPTTYPTFVDWVNDKIFPAEFEDKFLESYKAATPKALFEMNLKE